MEPDTITPADLARELGVSDRQVRRILRQHFGTLRPPAMRWHLTPEHVATVRRALSQ